MNEFGVKIERVDNSAAVNEIVEITPKSREALNNLFADDYNTEYTDIEEDGSFKDDCSEEGDSSANENLILNESEKQVVEYDEDGTRELTADEKQMLKDKLGWSDEKIEQKCRIDTEGVIHFKCRTEKENDSGIEYVTKRIEINEVKIEVTVPNFESSFDTQLSEENYESSNAKQFAECNKKLKEAIENAPDLRDQFTEEQLHDIKNGDTPRGYTWHHNEEPGKMQLVKTEDHDQCIGGAPHTGGNSLWGNKAREKSQEGVKF